MVKMYKVKVCLPTILDVPATSEEDAKQRVIQMLIDSKQMKPADYAEISIIEQ